jgi:hypothetical protein
MKEKILILASLAILLLLLGWLVEPEYRFKCPKGTHVSEIDLGIPDRRGMIARSIRYRCIPSPLGKELEK